jgi:hypothetical protein
VQIDSFVNALELQRPIHREPLHQEFPERYSSFLNRPPNFFPVSNKMEPDIGGVIDTAAIVNQATELKRLSASVAFDQTLKRKIQRC